MDKNNELGWAPLRNNYMLTSSKLKDWDKMPVRNRIHDLFLFFLVLPFFPEIINNFPLTSPPMLIELLPLKQEAAAVVDHKQVSSESSSDEE